MAYTLCVIVTKKELVFVPVLYIEIKLHQEKRTNEMTLSSGYRIWKSSPGALRTSTLPLGRACVTCDIWIIDNEVL